MNSYHHGNLRETIINIALQTLIDMGESAITMREIGRQAGVSHTAMYRHFENKSTLMAAIAANGFHKLGDKLQEIRLDKSADTSIRFRRMGIEYILFAVQNAPQYRLMYGSESVQHDEHPLLQAAAQRLSREVYKMIRLCQYSAVLKPGDARQMTYTVWSMSHGAAMLIIDGHIQVDDLYAFANEVTENLRVGIELRNRHKSGSVSPQDSDILP